MGGGRLNDSVAWEQNTTCQVERWPGHPRGRSSVLLPPADISSGILPCPWHCSQVYSLVPWYPAHLDCSAYMFLIFLYLQWSELPVMRDKRKVKRYTWVISHHRHPALLANGRHLRWSLILQGPETGQFTAWWQQSTCPETVWLWICCPLWHA